MNLKSILLLLLLLPAFGFAQKVTMQVSNAQGFDFSASGLLISSSIGEPTITTINSGESIITQGFLQPEIIPCNDAAISYYPNPTKDDLTVEINGCETEIESMQLIDIWGRVLTTLTPTKNNSVYLGDISPGVYFIRVFLTNTESQTIKIAKVSN
jgi:hypothetical protein